MGDWDWCLYSRIHKIDKMIRICCIAQETTQYPIMSYMGKESKRGADIHIIAVQLQVTSDCDQMECSVPSSSALHHLLEFTQVHVPCVSVLSNHHILFLPLLLCLQSFPTSRSLPISWLFISGGSVYQRLIFSNSPFNEYQGLISFRIDSFDFLAVQRNLKNLLQHHNSKASILRSLVFFTVQL